MTGIFLLLELSEAASKIFFPAQKCAGIFYAAVAQPRERWRDQTDGGPHPSGCSNFFAREVVDTLNDRQKRFCDEYLVDSDATKAALRAGYSPKTARNACKWLNEGNPQKPSGKFNPEMRAYIDDRLAQLHSKKTADAQEVLEYLTSVMRGKHKEQTLVLCGDGMQEIEDIDVSARDRLKAAELIGKRYGMFKDNVELGGPIPVVISGDEQLVD